MEAQMPDKKERKKRISITIDESLMERTYKMALDEGRSFSSAVNYILRRYFDAKD
jgi:uncharacterized protein (DUF4415 family)